jgi:hypothetical protein
MMQAPDAGEVINTDVCKDTEYFDGSECRALTQCLSNEFESVPPAPDHDRTCKPLTECGSDQFAVPSTQGLDRTCTPLKVCPAGTYVSKNPTATTDRECTPCTGGQFSSQANVDMCKPWKICAASETESVAPDLTSDRVCSACGSGKYSLQGVCTLLTECTSAQYESKAATATADRACTAISDCAAGNKQTAPPTRTTDRQCAPCGANSFSTQKNSDTCANWTVCSATQYETSAPSTISNRVCNNLTVCTQGQRIKTAAGATTNRECETCLNGTYSTTDNATNCTAWTQCNAGTYVTPGSTIADQSCPTCANGKFSTTKNAVSCQSWRTCGGGQGETVMGSTSTDRTCGPCATGTYSTSGTCTACSSGTFSATTGATSCGSCTVCGWFSASMCTTKVDSICTKQDTARQEGTADTESSAGVVVDSSGNVWVAGTTNLNGTSDAVLYKYDSKGTKLKTIPISTTAADRAYGLALDTAGNVWVGGTTNGSLKSGANPTGATMGFGARFAPDGTAKGVVQFASVNGTMTAITAGNAGDVWMTCGTNLIHITDNAGNLSSTTPGDYSQVSTPATGISESYAITVDQNGNPWTTGTVDGGLYVYKGTPSGDVFSTSARFTVFGKDLFQAQTLAIRARGNNVWVLGKIRSDRFDDTDTSVPEIGFGGRDGFIVRFSASDAVAHEATQFGELGDEYVTSTFVDSAGSLWVSGQTNWDYAGKPRKGGFDLFATRFTIPTGAGKAVQTSETYLVGTDQQEYGGWITLDASGRLWMAGSTEGQFPGGVANAGSADLFVMQVGK